MPPVPTRLRFVRAFLTCFAVASALLTVPMVSAGGSVVVTGAGSTQAEGEARSLLERSAETMAGLESFHFALSTPRGQTLILESIELVQLDGDVQRPDRFRASISARAAIIDVSLRIVGIGDRVWLTNPLVQDETFEELDLGQGVGGSGMDGTSLLDLLNPDRILLQAVERIENPSIVSQDEIDGIDVTRVDGTVDLGQLEADGTPIPGLVTDAPIPLSIWIDESGRVIRLELEGPLTAVESPDVLRRLDLSGFDEPVEIEAPV